MFGLFDRGPELPRSGTRAAPITSEVRWRLLFLPLGRHLLGLLNTALEALIEGAKNPSAFA
jgi:hypothetical protein